MKHFGTTVTAMLLSCLFLLSFALAVVFAMIENPGVVPIAESISTKILAAMDEGDGVGIADIDAIVSGELNNLDLPAVEKIAYATLIANTRAEIRNLIAPGDEIPPVVVGDLIRIVRSTALVMAGDGAG